MSDGPYAPPSDGGSGDAIKPMTILSATGWTFATTLFFLLAISLVIAARPAAKDDLVSMIGCQVVAYSLGVFLVLRVHGPRSSIRRFLGVRRTSWAVCGIALLLGPALSLPFNALYAWVVERFPPAHPSDLQAIYQASSAGRRIMLGMGIVAVGPLLEEIFFRGALFGPVARKDGPTAAVAATALLFAMVHLEWQAIVWILLMGVILGALRSRSGSLVPSVLVHASFNAVTVGAVAVRFAGQPRTVWIAGAVVVSIILIGLALWIAGRSEAAQAAREEDLA